MSLALYRKYRPSTFADLVGQDPIRTSLTSQVARGSTAHAYLFSGPRGVGKTSTARILARAINCEHPTDGEPDNTCAFCVDILEGRSLDIIEIDAASNTGVDHVRDHIIENSRFTPQRLKYKVFIIDEVHMLSSSAFNALLKTLEEPPAHVLFIMATTEVHRVPETILSRCQRFDFQRISVPDLMRRVQLVAEREHVVLDEDVARAIARRARGSSRDAEVLLTQVIGLGERHITRQQADLVIPRTDATAMLAFVQALNDRDLAQALSVINQLVQDGVHMGECINELIELVRLMVYVKATGTLTELEQGALDDGTAQELPVRVKTMTLERLTFILQTLIDRKQDFRMSPLPQIPLELAALHIILGDQDQSSHVSVAPQPRSKTPPPAPKKAPVVSPISTPARDIPPPATPSTVSRADTPEPPTGDTARGPHITIDELQAAWPKVLETIKGDHRGLYLVLKSGKPLEVGLDGARVGFPFKLLADQADSDRCRKVLADAFVNVLGFTIAVHPEVVDSSLLREATPESSAPEETTPGIASILESMGGEVVREE